MYLPTYLPTRLHGFVTQKTSIMQDPLWKLLQYTEHSNAVSFLQPESKQSQLTFRRNMLSNKLLHDTEREGEMTKYKKRQNSIASNVLVTHQCAPENYISIIIKDESTYRPTVL